MSARGVGRIDRFVLGLLLTLSSAALSQSGVTKSKAALLLASDVACGGQSRSCRHGNAPRLRRFAY